MPELAEVEYYRRRWSPGLNRRVLEVTIHASKRIFRDTSTTGISSLARSTFSSSRAYGKQMLFGFSGGRWLIIHLGLSGHLHLEDRTFAPDRHDHLVLRQTHGSLVYSDPRLFGRIRFVRSRSIPEEWADLPAEILSGDFTADVIARFLHRRCGSPIKAVLLDQAVFPGVGNWMADEILWRAEIHPDLRAGRLDPDQVRRLWRETRMVSRRAMEIVAPNYGPFPRSWLFPHRWKDGGICPKTKVPLVRERIGGRTTCWSPGRQEDPRIPSSDSTPTTSVVRPPPRRAAPPRRKRKGASPRG